MHMTAGEALTGSYDYQLVALSVLIAVGASYVALDLAGRTAAARGRARLGWLAGGAVSMGLGIWSMHYIGMLAFTLPVPVLYDLPEVGVSLLAAVAASGVALFVVSRKTLDLVGAIAGSIVMGAGIAAMHYIGMAAMRLPAMCRYDLGLVALSVVIAIVVSLVALWLAFRFRTETRELAPLKIASAAVMGIAVASMHYTGMAAASFVPAELTEDVSNAVSISQLGIAGIVTVTFMVLALALLTAMVNRRFSAQSLELQASETRYRLLFERSLAGLYRSTVDGRLLDCNEAFSRIFGYPSREACLRETTTALYPDPATRESFVQALRHQRRLSDVETLLRRQDGSPVWVLDNASLLAGNDEGAEVIEGSILDISVRKQAEKHLAQMESRYHGLLEAAPDAMVVVNQGGEIVLLNVQAEKQFGYRRDALVGQKVKNIIPEGFAERLLADALRSPADALAQQMGTGIELTGRRKDGSEFPIEIMLSPLESAEAVLVTAAIRDISARRKAEAQLLQAQKMEAVGRLAGGVAHDFNNLLGVITGYSELLLNNVGPQHPGSKMVKEIQKAAERAAGLTGQLLAFSRKQVLQPRILDLNEVVADVEEMLRRVIGEDIQLVTTPGAGLGRIRADPGQIEQVLMNLVVNARDAMPKGGGLILETTNVALDDTYAREHPEIQPGQFVMLAVSDTGVGMDAHTQAHIFEPFFTTKEEGKGTGLGLATVFGIVQQSGGSVSVYSQLGMGTTCKVYFPRVEDELSRPSQAPPDAPPTRGTETILLVEDADSLRVMIREILEGVGYTVLESSDPEDALRRVSTLDAPVRLLLTDVVMPRMSGPDLARSVQIARPEIKVLFMSGYTDEAMGLHGVLDAGTRFIQKPFTANALFRKVREALDDVLPDPPVA